MFHKTGTAPQNTTFSWQHPRKRLIQAIRTLYRLKHHITSTIYAAMGYILTSIAEEIPLTNSNINMWDKGQIIVILSHLKRNIGTKLSVTKNHTPPT